MGVFALIVGGIVLVALAVYLSGSARGLLRFVVAAIMGIAIAAFGIGFFRQFGMAPPPEEPPADVPAELGLIYVCEICGLELSVIKASKEKSPKHCGEEMTLIRREMSG